MPKALITATLAVLQTALKVKVVTEVFVKEAVTDANLLGMERPTIASETMRECARRDWNVIEFES